MSLNQCAQNTETKDFFFENVENIVVYRKLIRNQLLYMLIKFLNYPHMSVYGHNCEQYHYNIFVKCDIWCYKNVYMDFVAISKLSATHV